jgi:two-component sensor histidine kinase
LGLKRSLQIVVIAGALTVLLIMPKRGCAQWINSDSLSNFVQLKQQFRNKNPSESLNPTVYITGIINTASGLLHEKYLQTYLQNDTGGISIFGYEIDEPVSPGDSVVAKGNMQIYNGEPELLVKKYKVYSSQKRALNPVDGSYAIRNPQKYQGMLVKTEGTIVKKGNAVNGKYLIISPADTVQKTILIYVTNFHALYQDFDFRRLSIGDKIKVTGVLEQYKTVLEQYEVGFSPGTVYTVLLRTPSDLSYAGLPRYYVKIITVILLGVIIIAIIWMVSLRVQVKRKTRALEKLLAEKEILLKEIHHRINNNLASISGFLDLQSDTIDNKQVQNAFQSSQVRIEAIAKVHEKLYNTASLAGISMPVYLDDLANSIHSTFTTNADDIAIQIDADEISLPTDKVIHIGLLVNELLTNAFKHAFKDEGKGVIQIDFHIKNERFQLKVEDNGKGLPINTDSSKSDSLGMMLIETFSQQLEADRTIQNTPGACFTFEFS